MKRLPSTFLKLVLKHFFEFKWFYFFAVIFLTLTHYLQSEVPFFAKEIGDALLAGGKLNLIYYCLVGVGIILFRTSSRLLFFYPARVQQKYLRVEIIELLENSHPDQYKSFNSGQIYQTLFNDLAQIRAVVGFGFLQIANVIVAFYVLVPKIAQFDSRLLIAFLPMLIGVLVYGSVVTYLQKYFKKAQDYQGEVQNFLIESFDGKKSIQNFHAEESFLKLFKEFSWRELATNFKAAIGIEIFEPMVKLSVGISFLWAAYLVYDLKLSATVLILFSGFLYLFVEPLMMLSWIGLVFVRGKASWERIDLLVNCLLKSQDHSSYVIKFWDKKIDLKIEKDAFNVLVGETGVGKTTLLLRLADYYRSLGEKVNFIFQEPYLYNDSIRKNLFLGRRPSAEDEALALKYFEIFGLTDLTPHLKDLLDLEVGENGKRLSGGQIKRVALIRSLVSEANIIIWDDPFSSVDILNEKQIFDSLKNELAGKKTLILSTHRLSTLRFCQHVTFLDKEKGILESGLVTTLLTPGNRIYEFFKKQMV